MSIKYYLRHNNLKKDTTEYRASVVHRDHISLERVINRMLEQGSTVTKADALSVLTNFQRVIEQYLEEGCTVKTPFANFSSSIKGSFSGVTDVFDNGRHKIVPVVNAGRELHAHYRQGIPTHKVEATINAPNLLTYKDIDSGKKDTIITPGGMAKIWGSRLKFDLNDPSQGIFFIDVDGREYRASVIGENSPSKLIFNAPADLSKGEYKVSVRNDNGTGVFKKDLVVE